MAYPLEMCETHDNGLALINWLSFLSGSCIYGHMAALSWVASTLSVAGWILAGLYQISLCYRTKEASGFSVFFLLSWVIGDITNVIGCYFTDQMMFQRVLSTSSLLLDGTILAQFFYYGRYYKNGRPRSEYEDDVDADDFDKLQLQPQSSSSSSSSSSKPSPLMTGLIVAAYSTRAASGAPIPVDSQAIVSTLASSSTSHSIGIMCGWICQTLYLLSPIPQIFKNFQAKSTGGVSIALFLADMLGNLGYSMSIIAAAETIPDAGERIEFLREERPYLTGTTITFILELIIFWQYFYYGNGSLAEPTSVVYLESESFSDEEPMSISPLKGSNAKVSYRSVEEED